MERAGERHHLCSAHQHERLCPSSAPAATAIPAEPASPLSAFGRPSGCIDQLTLVERAAIVTLHNVGWTGRDIAQELRCSENTVSLWWKRWQETRSLEDAERSGRPRSTTDATDEEISLHTWEHEDQPARVVLRELGLRVHWRTVRRRMNEVGLRSHVKRFEQELTAEHRRNRVQWAQDYSRWTDEDWATVMWSDHKLFILGHHGREYVNCPAGHSRDPRYTQQAPKLEGAVWLWGSICQLGLGHAELYVGDLDARQYQSILSLNLKRSARVFWPNSHWWYQQDRASPHTAGTTSLWFNRNGIDCIDWPSKSPDLNPIENLWSDLERRVYAHNPRTMEELEHWIGVEWADTDLDHVARMCSNMRQRLQLVMAYEGHRIPY